MQLWIVMGRRCGGRRFRPLTRWLRGGERWHDCCAGSHPLPSHSAYAVLLQGFVPMVAELAHPYC